MNSGSNTRSLDASQRAVLKAFKRQRSLAILGGAGSGKTFVLKEVIRCARNVTDARRTVAVCALSNAAASSLEGCTLHSIFGAPSGWEWSKKFLWEQISSNQRRSQRLRDIRILVIDEISLIKRNEIEAIDFVLRKLTKTEEEAGLPLGGRQLIVAGDPFQLEPAGVEDTKTYFETFFQSRVWFLLFTAYGDGVVSVLDRNHRQSGDSEFFSMLQRFRYGDVRAGDFEILNGTSTSLPLGPPREWTRLCLRKKDVFNLNEKRLKELPGPQITAISVDTYTDGTSSSLPKYMAAKLDEVAPRTVLLRINCLVILTRKCGNFNPGSRFLVREVLVGCSSEQDQNIDDIALATVLKLRLLPLTTVSSGHAGTGAEELLDISPEKFHVHNYDRSIAATRVQIPVLLGYAMTVHRSQGMSLETVAVDFSEENWKPNGLVYVALSRCTKLSGLWIKGLRAGQVCVSERAKVAMYCVQSLQAHLPRRVIGERALRECLMCVKGKVGDGTTQDTTTGYVRSTSLKRPALRSLDNHLLPSTRKRVRTNATNM